jgi:type I restriction enzyme S subunit
MKRYEAYKDSGIEWIGEVPEHWTISRLKNIGKLYSGLSGKSGADFNNDEALTNKPFVNFTNVANNKYIVGENFGLVSMSPEEEQNKVLYGDLLFLMSSENMEDVGKSALVNHDFGELYLNSFCKGFRIIEKDIEARFINYFCNSNAISQIISNEGRGFTRINLRMEGIQNTPLLLPYHEEQKAIANYLDRKTSEIDSLVEKKKQLITLLQEERTAIINHAVTKGIDPNVKLKDSGIEWIGEIPEHWEIGKVKYVTDKIGSGVTPKGGAEVYELSGIPLLRSQNIYFEGFRLENVAYISQEIHKSMRGSRVIKGDVLLNITGGSIGRCYYVTDEFKEANVNQHVCIVRPNNLITTKFLYYVLSSSVGQLQIDLSQIGGNREALNFEQLKNFFIPLQSISEQLEICSFVENKVSEIEIIIIKAKRELELLEEYKIALISEVVTGKVDVREEVVN